MILVEINKNLTSYNDECDKRRKDSQANGLSLPYFNQRKTQVNVYIPVDCTERFGISPV